MTQKSEIEKILDKFYKRVDLIIRMDFIRHRMPVIHVKPDVCIHLDKEIQP